MNIQVLLVINFEIIRAIDFPFKKCIFVKIMYNIYKECLQHL